MLEAFGVERSLSAKGRPHGDAADESTSKILKAEPVYRDSFSDLRDLQAKLSDYVHRCNDFRIHSTLGYMSPVEFRKAGADPVETVQISVANPPRRASAPMTRLTSQITRHPLTRINAWAAAAASVSVPKTP